MASKFLPLDEKLSEVFKGGGKSHVLFSGAIYIWHMHNDALEPRETNIAALEPFEFTHNMY